MGDEENSPCGGGFGDAVDSEDDASDEAAERGEDDEQEEQEDVVHSQPMDVETPKVPEPRGGAVGGASAVAMHLAAIGAGASAALRAGSLVGAPRSSQLENDVDDGTTETEQTAADEEKLLQTRRSCAGR